MDIWRDLHPLTPGFTWESPDHARASRIDLIGCPAVWAPFVSFCNFLPCPFSDHSVVHLSISPPVFIPRGPGRWKCNISILEDPEPRSEIESFWIYWRTRQPFFPSVGKWWDKDKKVIRSLISHHCSFKEATGAGPLDPAGQALEGETRCWHDFCGGAPRIRLTQHCRHEQNRSCGSPCPCSWEKGRRGGNLFKIFLSPREETWGGSVVLSPPHGGWHQCFKYQRDICAMWSAFYSSLFSEEPTDPGDHNFLLQHLESTLPDEASLSCDGLLSEDELLIHGMARGKAPGLDGLPLEFYLSFWHLLAPDVLTVLNFSFREGHFPISLRSGIITLLFKRGAV